MRTLYPVIIPVAAFAGKMSMRGRVAELSRRARQATRISAQKSGLQLSGNWPKDQHGTPLPDRGIFWSLTHKPGYVAGVAACQPVGIDLEQIKPRKTEALFAKVAAEQEWRLVPDRNWLLFYRFWTAKEAVLKAAGIGLKGLSACRVVAVDDDRRLHLDYRQQLWQVEQFYFDGHIASLVRHANSVRWCLLDDVPPDQPA